MRQPRRTSSPAVLLALCVLASTSASLAAEEPPVITFDGLEFSSWQEYVASDYFKEAGGRCATPDRESREMLWGPSFPVLGSDPADCSAFSTNPDPIYGPNTLYEIQVVVHIIENTSGSGQISDALVDSQIEILNEDFLAIMGTNGGNGNDARIRFALATEDPDGMPTTGITRSVNNTWFADGGNYWDTLAWDPHRYMNVYTNSASGALGYVPFLPADAGGIFVGGNNDRVVVLWSSFGRDAPIGPPYNQGRTLTHEVGHYLGLEHTFNGGCADPNPPGCYNSGDLICDTNSEASPTFSPCFLGAKVTCGTVDPSDNYMDYSDDLCMMQFTVEQGRRNRCTMENYRPGIWSVVDSSIFTDGFESGDFTGWTSSVP